MKNLEPSRARWIRVRISLVALVLIVGASLVSRRAFELAVVEGPALREMAEEQHLRDIQLAPKRGSIVDRNGAELAVSVDVDSVWANPRELRRRGGDPAVVARAIAQVLAIDVPTVERRLASDRYFVWIERQITPQQARTLRELALPGVALSREAKRFYPNRELAAHLVGFANVDGRGIEGLELAYEDRLRGRAQRVPAVRDRRGRVVFSEQLFDDRASAGDDLVLTIDKAIQHVAEQELALAVHTFEARAGMVVVMEPETGDLLAVANYPSFNPNDPSAVPAGSRRNRAVTDRFEPGSTIKPFTVAGALAAGAIAASQEFDCEDGAMQVAEYTVHDSHRWEALTPSQILAYSSNIGTAKIGAALGRAGLYRTLRRFGFGEETGLGLPGEASGILRNYRRWYEMDAVTISFGQGMSATTLQLAVAMSALANGGKLMKPRLVRRVVDARGQVVEEFPPEVRRRVLTPGVSRLVADMLTAVTGPGGTGPDAAIDGYLVAGKTGTAQKADYVHGGYAPDVWTASFVGFVPAHAPRLTIAVVIDEPIIDHYGGIVAGPVFRRVGEAALRHLGVPGTRGGEAIAERARELRVEARRERERRDDVAEAEVAEVDAAVVEASAPIAPGDGEVLVPDLVGISARGALVRARAAALVAELEGTGIVRAQAPVAGAIVPRGARVRLQLGPASMQDVPSSLGAHVDGPLAQGGPNAAAAVLP